MSKQIKSKERVSEHGEVFTDTREVNAMLNMIQTETERIDSRFLEPACGNGNFLAEILNRKLAIVTKQYKKNPMDWEQYSILALTSLYGVDLLEDNITECRDRLFQIWYKDYKKSMKIKPDATISKVAKFILKCNILCGDALTMLTNEHTPIIFSQWDFVLNGKMKRIEYRFDELLEGNGKKGTVEEFSLFDNGDDECIFSEHKDWIYDSEIDAYVPGPIKEYPIVFYRNIADDAGGDYE